MLVQLQLEDEGRSRVVVGTGNDRHTCVIQALEQTAVLHRARIALSGQRPLAHPQVERPVDHGALLPEKIDQGRHLRCIDVEVRRHRRRHGGVGAHRGPVKRVREEVGKEERGVIDLVEAKVDRDRHAHTPRDVTTQAQSALACLAGNRGHEIRVQQVVQLDLLVAERVVHRHQGPGLCFVARQGVRRPRPGARSLDETAENRAWRHDPAAVRLVPDRDADIRIGCQVPDRRDPRRQLHHRPERGAGRLEVRVHVPESGQHSLSGRVDDRGTGRHRHGVRWTNSFDPVTTNHHGGLRHHDAALGIEHVAIPDHDRSLNGLCQALREQLRLTIPVRDFDPPHQGQRGFHSGAHRHEPLDVRRDELAPLIDPHAHRNETLMDHRQPHALPRSAYRDGGVGDDLEPCSPLRHEARRPVRLFEQRSRQQRGFPGNAARPEEHPGFELEGAGRR